MEAVGRKKRICISGERGRLQGVTLSNLRQYSEALKEKSDVLKCLDGEILELVKEEELEKEIEQADVFFSFFFSIFMLITVSAKIRTKCFYK